MIDSVKNGNRFNFQLLLLILFIFNWRTTLDRLATMATRKDLSLIYEIQNFANTYLGKSPSFKVMACSVSEFRAIY